MAELEEGRRRNVILPVLEDLSWLIVRPVRDRTLLPLVTHLGDGEKEVLALGLETQDALLLLDDRDARRYARTLEIVFLPKSRASIDTRQLQPSLNISLYGLKGSARGDADSG